VPCLFWAALPHGPVNVAVQLGASIAGFALFLGWTLVSHARRPSALADTELAAVVANPTAFLIMASIVLSPVYGSRYMGLFIIAQSAVHFAVAKHAWVARDMRDPRLGKLALGVAIALFTLAVPIQLTGVQITIGWALEGAVLAWFAKRHASDLLSMAGGGVIGLGLLALLAHDTPVLASQPLTVMLNARILAFAAVAASVLAAASLLRHARIAASAGIIGHVVLMTGLGLEAANWAARAFIEDPVAAVSVAISILLALYAVFLVALGVVRRHRTDRIFGLAVLGVVIAKLYISDVWSLGRAFRITAFLGLGALLLLVSYLYARYRPAIERLWKDAPAPR